MASYLPGEMIADRYRVERELGAGGFGDVYEATELGVYRRVAIKVLKPDDGRGYKPSTRARFQREARAVGQLQSPHTVTLLDFGESDGKLYMAFELVPGEDLRTIINRQGRLDPKDAVHILRQLLDSLGEAHRAGILHRDIKPANIRVFPWGDNPMFVKLLDFGLARPTDHGSPGITVTGELLGTPRYMSPEQLSAKPLTPASDIYSLGIVLMEMLIGPSPLQGNQWHDQFERVMSGHVFSFVELESVGPDLLKLVHQMTARDPAARPSAASALPRAPRARPTIPRPAHSGSRATQVAYAAIGFGLVAAVGAAIVVGSKTSAPTPADADLLAVEPTTPFAPVHPEPVELDASHAQVPDVEDVDHGGCTAAIDPGWYIEPTHDWPNAVQETWGTPPLYLYRPRAEDTEPIPVVIVLPRDRDKNFIEMGVQTNAIGTFRKRFVEDTRLPELADNRKFVIVIPPASFRWNDTVEGADVQRVRDALNRTSELLCIDRGRVFVIGDEFGGLLAYKLIEQPWITGVATWAFRPERGQEKYWSRNGPPMPLLKATPMKSRLFPLEATMAGNACFDGESFDAWERRWRARNKCGPESKPWAEGERCKRFTDCDSPLVTCRLPGGYEWPRTTVRSRRKLEECGPETAISYPLGAVIWEFFASLDPLPTQRE